MHPNGITVLCLEVMQTLENSEHTNLWTR